MKYVMIYENDPNDLALAHAHYPEHRAQLQEFHDRGVLLLAGPLVDPVDGALGIFTTREAAAEFVARDPFVRHGLVKRWQIRDWNEVLG